MTKMFALPRKLTVLDRNPIRVTVRAHPFVQGRKVDARIIRNLAPRKPLGQRYSRHFFANSSVLLVRLVHLLCCTMYD